MALNLLKVYDDLLDLLYPSIHATMEGLKRIFDRDFIKNLNSFTGRPIEPTPKMGFDSMDILFIHLTTEIVDQRTRKREFETDRSIRLHWIRHHFENPGLVAVYSVPDEKRVYLWNNVEDYVIVLEPFREKNHFYLLTAYKAQRKSKEKLKKKFARGFAGLQ